MLHHPVMSHVMGMGNLITKWQKWKWNSYPEVVRWQGDSTDHSEIMQAATERIVVGILSVKQYTLDKVLVPGHGTVPKERRDAQPWLWGLNRAMKGHLYRQEKKEWKNKKVKWLGNRCIIPVLHRSYIITLFSVIDAYLLFTSYLNYSYLSVLHDI